METLTIYYFEGITEISIHSTARVETAMLFLARPNFLISIHSTARVETQVTNYLNQHNGISIHSTARVETILNALVNRCLDDFNPLHREGGDASIVRTMQKKSDFNPLHREGGDRLFDIFKILHIISIHSTARVETLTAISSMTQ